MKLSKLYLFLILSSYFKFTESVKFIFCHGLGANKAQIAYYHKSGYSKEFDFITDDFVTFDFEDVKSGVENSNLGQEGDINSLSKEVDIILKENPEEQIVLFGLSRGATTILNYAGSLPKKVQNNIKALVVEAPFDDLRTIIHNKISQFYLNWIPLIDSIAFSLTNNVAFRKYNDKGLKPINSVLSIPTNIPILFVHSKEDYLIPATCSKNLYNILKNRGHKDIYYLQLPNGSHANYQFKCHNLYAGMVHAFYKKYGIKYDINKTKRYTEKTLNNLRV